MLAVDCLWRKPTEFQSKAQWLDFLCTSQENFNEKGMVRCENCGRTFLEDWLISNWAHV